MYVSNKYDVGDEVYYLIDENRACKSKVKQISIRVLGPNYKNLNDDDGPVIEYLLSVSENETEWIPEEWLFGTEWELKDWWIRDLIEFV